MPHAVLFHSPFDATKTETYPIPLGVTVQEWLDASGMADRMRQQPIALYRNNEELLEERFGDVVQPNDVIVAAALPTANALVSVGGWIAKNWSWIGPAIALGGTLVSYLNQPDFSEGNPTGSAFDVSARGNKARLGAPIPFQVGTFRRTPDWSALPFSEFDARGNQVLTMLYEIGLGEHTVDTSTMRFEDTLLSSFQSVTYEVLDPGQQSTLYPSAVNVSGEVASTELVTTLGPFAANASATTITQIGVDLIAPGGLYRQRSNGKQQRLSVSVRFEAREIDDAGVPIGGFFTLGTAAISGNSNTPVRKTYRYSVTAGRYEVQAIRVTPDSSGSKIADTVEWGQLRGYLADTLPAPQTTRIAVRFRGSEDLGNRALSNFNVVCTRRLRTWSTGGGWAAPADSSSIAWGFAEIATANYGGKRADALLDLETLETFDASLPAGFECNGFIDTRMTVWDALKRVSHCAMASPIDPNGVLSIVRDIEQPTPTQMFNMRNIVRGTFFIDRAHPTDETPDYVIAEFHNRDEDWRLDEVDCILPGGTSNLPKRERIWGVTDRDHAWEIGMFMAAENRFRRARVEFESGLEARIPGYKETIVVSHLLVGQEGFDQISADVRAYDSGTNVLTLSESGLTGRFTTPYVVLRDLEGEPRGPYTCTVVADNQIDIDDAAFTDDSFLVFDADYERPKVSVGEGVDFMATVKVTNVEPRGNDRYRISGFIDALGVYSITNGEIPPPAQALPPLVERVPTITNLTAQTTGSPLDKIVSLTWDAQNCDRFDAEYSLDSGTTWIDAGEPRVPRFTDDPETDTGTIRYRVSGVSVFPGPWAEVDVDLDAPGNPIFVQLGSRLYEDFSNTTLEDYLADWNEEIDIGGEEAIITDTASPVGDQVLQLGNNSGNDEVSRAGNLAKRIPIVEGEIYRLRVIASVEAGANASLFAGLSGVAADGATLVNRSGADTHAGQHYFAANSEEPTLGQYIEYLAYFTRQTGTAASDSGTNLYNSIDNPAYLHEDAHYVVPHIRTNYDNESGETRIALVEIARVDSRVDWATGVVGANKPEDNATVGAGEGEALRNPGFEHGDRDWFLDPNCEIRENAVVHTGTWSLRITEAGGVNRDAQSSNLPVTPGEVCVAEAWMYQTNARVGGPIRIAIRWLEADGSYISDRISDDFSSLASVTWHPIRVSGVAPANAAIARVRLLSSGQTAGTTFFDDTTFSRVGQESVTTRLRIGGGRKDQGWSTSDGAIYEPNIPEGGTDTLDTIVEAEAGSVFLGSVTWRWTAQNTVASNNDSIQSGAFNGSSTGWTAGTVSGLGTTYATVTLTHTASGETITLSASILQLNVAGGK